MDHHRVALLTEIDGALIYPHSLFWAIHHYAGALHVRLGVRFLQDLCPYLHVTDPQGQPLDLYGFYAEGH